MSKKDISPSASDHREDRYCDKIEFDHVAYCVDCYPSVTELTRPNGTVGKIDSLYEDVTFGGTRIEEDDAIDEMIKDSAVMGIIPADTTLETLRETGFVRFTDSGGSPLALAQASDLKHILPCAGRNRPGF